jgi:hypothetical protein
MNQNITNTPDTGELTVTGFAPTVTVAPPPESDDGILAIAAGWLLLEDDA